MVDEREISFGEEDVQGVRLRQTKRFPLKIAQEAGLPGGERTEESEVGNKHVGFTGERSFTVCLLGSSRAQELINCGIRKSEEREKNG